MSQAPDTAEMKALAAFLSACFSNGMNGVAMREAVDFAIGRQRSASPAEPALWVSPKQLEAHDPQSTGKPNYLPAMKRQEGLFTLPLYAHPARRSPQQAGVLILEKVREYGRLADQVGRSRQANNYAMNTSAVKRLVDLEIELEAALTAPPITPQVRPIDADTSEIWPIVNIDVDDAGTITNAKLYAPGLPAGNHDVYPVKLPSPAPAPFQQRVQPWLLHCFGAEIAGDKVERNHRFLEESLELVQACGCTQSEAHQLVDYVFGRLVGEPSQEVGGVMVTLAALCLAQGLDMHAAGETELARIWPLADKIRAKQAAKPKHSPLPGPASETGANE